MAKYLIIKYLDPQVVEADMKGLEPARFGVGFRVYVVL